MKLTDSDFEDIAISTFKVGLPTEHSLRKSLTGKTVTSVCQLIDRSDKYKRVEENQQQGKGKDKVILRRGGILSRTDTITIGHREILLVSQDLPMLRRSMQCSENWCTRFWRKLRKNCSSNDQTRWLETP